MGNFNDYSISAGDSINLSDLGDKPFTIVSVEESNYEEQGKAPTPGVKISTVEEWEREDGTKVSKIHTTRRAIVSKLLNPEFLKAIESGETFTVKCPTEKVKSKKGGMPYFDLVAAD
jgi:hypothetical protein